MSCRISKVSENRRNQAPPTLFSQAALLQTKSLKQESPGRDRERESHQHSHAAEDALWIRRVIDEEQVKPLEVIILSLCLFIAHFTRRLHLHPYHFLSVVSTVRLLLFSTSLAFFHLQKDPISDNVVTLSQYFIMENLMQLSILQ